MLHANGQLKPTENYIGRSVINSRVDGRVISETTVGNHTVIIPEITGRAWISGTTQLLLDPDDPWLLGHKVTDTWPTRNN